MLKLSSCTNQWCSSRNSFSQCSWYIAYAFLIAIWSLWLLSYTKTYIQCLNHKQSYRLQLKHLNKILKFLFHKEEQQKKFNCFPHSSPKTKSIRTYSAPKVNLKKKHNQKQPNRKPQPKHSHRIESLKQTINSALCFSNAWILLFPNSDQDSVSNIGLQLRTYNASEQRIKKFKWEIFIW